MKGDRPVSAQIAGLEGLLSDLARFPAALRRQTASAPAAVLDFEPADWTGSPAEYMTIRQQVCHLRDIEIDGYHQRIGRTLAEDRPFLPSIDGHALCIERKYAEEPLEAALSAFEAARAETVEKLKALRANDLSRTAGFEGYGEVTLLGIVHYLASHDYQHMAGIHWLAAKYVRPA